MVNWTEVLSTKTNRSLVTKFATGELSGRALQERFAGTDVSGQIRSLVRNRGTQEARVIARKALRRRNVLV